MTDREQFFFKYILGYLCPHCGKAFTTPDTFNAEARIGRGGELVQEIKCNRCGITSKLEDLHDPHIEKIGELRPKQSSQEVSEAEQDSNVVNVLIFKSCRVRNDNDNLLENIKKQIKSGVVLLDTSVEFVGAFKMDKDSDIVRLYSSDGEVLEFEQGND